MKFDLDKDAVKNLKRNLPYLLPKFIVVIFLLIISFSILYIWKEVMYYASSIQDMILGTATCFGVIGIIFLYMMYLELVSLNVMYYLNNQKEK